MNGAGMNARGRPYPCPSCHHRFTTRGTLNRHRIDMHDPAPNGFPPLPDEIVCVGCGAGVHRLDGGLLCGVCAYLTADA